MGFADLVAEAVETLLNDAGVHAWVCEEDGVRIRSIRANGDTVEVIYERPEESFLIGLRAVVDPSRPAGEEAARLVVGCINEPLGIYADTLETDAEGVRWWAGDPIECWDDSTW